MFHTAGQVGYPSFCHSHVLDNRELALGSWKRQTKLGERQSQPQQHMEHSNFSKSAQHEGMNRKNKEENAKTCKTTVLGKSKTALATEVLVLLMT